MLAITEVVARDHLEFQKCKLHHVRFGPCPTPPGYVYVLCILVPRPRAPPSEKGGVWRRDYIMYEQRTC